MARSRSLVSSCWPARLAPLVLVAAVGCRTPVAIPLEPTTELAALAARSALVDDPPALAWSPVRPWLPVAAEIDLADGQLSLGEALAAALLHAPELCAARAEVGIAEAQLMRAGLIGDAELSAGPRFATSDSALTLPAALSVRVPLPAEARAERDVGAAELLATRWRLAATEARVLAEVLLAYEHVVALDSATRVLAATVTQSQELHDWLTRLHAMGEVDAGTLELARLDRARMVADAEDARVEGLRARAALLLQIGVPATSALRLDPALAPLPPLPPFAPESRLAHPRLRAVEAEYAAAEDALRLAALRQYPGLELGAEFESDDGAISIGPGIGLSVPHPDRVRGDLHEAEVRRRATRERFHAVALDLERTEIVARAELESLARQIAEHGQPDWQAAERALGQRLRAGQATAVEVLLARKSLADARVAVMELERRRRAATLEAALAGGHFCQPLPLDALAAPLSAQGK